uniref:CSON002290 protein n=1 Tax=Culicoides sonorensis TaxID=179676 RepID=A0A336MIP0_CULSO
MTPVLWAAFEGHLDALRLLVGKGGDPDRADQFGNSALHLAAARGHMTCVDFLVKFGCNLFALDIDSHTAKDLAAINNRDDILQYLDAAAAHLELSDKKQARNMKESAKKAADKRAKEYGKKHPQPNVKPSHIESNGHRPAHRSSSSNMLSTLRQKLWSGSHGNLKQSAMADYMTQDSSKRFSTLVNGGAGGNNGTITSKGAVQRKVLKTKQNESDDFKIGEIEPSGKRSVRSIQGVRRDSEILYVGTYETTGDQQPGKRGKISDVFSNNNNNHSSLNGDDSSDSNSRQLPFSTLSRSISQPNFMHPSLMPDTDEEQEALENNLLNRQANGNLFNRPLLGTLSIPQSMSAVLAAQQMEQSSDRSSSNESTNNKLNGNYRINGGNNQYGRIKGIRQLPVLSDTEDSEDDESNLDDSVTDGLSSIERFLIAWGLGDYVKIFDEQQIDLETLMLLTEADLKSLALPLGPYRKLCVAIQERKSALQNPGIIADTRF